MRPARHAYAWGVANAHDAAHRLVAAAGTGELDAVCARRRVRLLGLFGSATRPAPDREPDDLDVAVSFAEHPDELGLLDDLVRITGYDHIDLAVVDGAGPVLRAEAMIGVALFESEPGLYASTQMAALAQRRDTQWLRDLDLEALQR